MDNSVILRRTEVVRKSIKLFNTKYLKSSGYKLIGFRRAPYNHLTLNTEAYWICLLRSNTLSGFYQVHGHRAVDLSIIPVISRANTYVATIMIAEKAADIIKER